MAVEVLAGKVVAHGGARVCVPGGDLHVAQAHASVEHGGYEHVPEHVRVHPRYARVTSDLEHQYPRHGRCGRCEAQPMRSASETTIPSGPRT